MTNYHGMVKDIRIGESATKHPERMKAQRLSLGRALIDNRSTALVFEVGENPLNGSALTLF